MGEPALKLVETEEVENKALSIVDQAKAVKVTDAQTYTAAGILWKQIGEMISEVKSTFDPICEAAHKAHKAATEKRSKFLDPLTTAQKSVKQIMSAYDAEQERIRKAEEERLAAIARKEEEERRRVEQERLEAERKAEEDRLLAEAQAAQDRGDSETAEILTNAAVETSEAIKEQAAAIAQEPIYVAPVVVPKTTPKMAGGPVYQERWYAEVTSIEALCAGASRNFVCKELLDATNALSDSIAKREIIYFIRKWHSSAIGASVECVLPNMPTLNRMAVALKNTMNIPGVKAYSKRV